MRNEERRKSKLRRILKWLLLGAIVLFIVYNFSVTSSNDSGTSFFGQFRHLITSKDKPVEGEEQDRVNILLLGTGGTGHEGPNLTDTIILLSFRPSDKRVSMLSIPRDLLVEFPGYGFRKINHVYALSEAYEPESGGPNVSRIMKKVFNVPIHYYARVNFEGFIEFIDDIGGVTVNVQNTLEDPYYPVQGKETATTSERYEHLIIEKGIRHMDGDTALKYVRSRKALGVEGSDFSRSQRQQKVLLAAKEKVLSFGTLFNPNRIIRIIKTLQDNIDTNLEAWEIARLYSLAKNVGSQDIRTFILDDSEESPLKVYSAPDAYFLTTKSGDNSELQSIATRIFDEDLEIKTTVEKSLAQQKTDIESEYEKQSLRVEVHNGTKITGLAGKVSLFLRDKNYSVINIQNAPIQTYKKTLIYDLRTDLNKNVIKDLNEHFDAITFSSGPPIDYAIDPAADILIILGEDASTKF